MAACFNSHVLYITLVIIILFDVSRCQDVTPPDITCPANVVLEYPADTSPAATGAATCTDVVDPDPALLFTDAITTTCSVLEVITRTWTCTDDEGNSSDCEQLITVDDTTPPVIDCPSDAVLESGDDSSSGGTGVATCTDLVTPLVIDETDTVFDGACSTESTILREWSCTDCKGSEALCMQTIQIEDTIAPGFVVCPADTSILEGDPVPPPEAVSCDDVSAVIEFVEVTVDCSEVIRTWTCTDDCGNANQCVQTITIVCTPSPTTPAPTTPDPTTPEPTTPEPTTPEPTTPEPTTPEPTTPEPTTPEPTTPQPSTLDPTTPEPTMADPTKAEPTTAAPTFARISDSSGSSLSDDDSSESGESAEISNVLLNGKVRDHTYKKNDGNIAISLDNKTKGNLIAVGTLFVFVNLIGWGWMYCANQKEISMHLSETEEYPSP